VIFFLVHNIRGKSKIRHENDKNFVQFVKLLRENFVLKWCTRAHQGLASPLVDAHDTIVCVAQETFLSCAADGLLLKRITS
jgi:hypothetical protein